MPSPGRRVHFLYPDTNTILSPPPLTPPVIPLSPLTPSPTYSDFSLPSSDPLTPPSLPYHLSPVRTVGNVTRVHPVIAYNDRTPPLYFDVASPPSRSLPIHSPSSGSQRGFLPHASQASPPPLGFEPVLLNEPATYPPLSSITLMSDLLPWSIHVEASASLSVPVVTIFDVLQTLYITLRIPIAPCEWANVPTTAQSLISAAFYRRIDGIRDYNLRDSQRRKGVRRVDFLTGRTRLIGLSPVPDKPGVFVVSWGLT